MQFAIAGKAPEAKDTPPEQFVFEIGSITKVFTGLLLAQAVVDQKVTLETTIGSLLGAKVQFADPRIAAITLKQLSTHTSGLPRLPANAAAGMVEGDPYANYNEKLLFAYLAAATLDGDGPYSCSYSNLGVGLLGHLLGKVYAKGWEDAVVTKICLPLRMQNTKVQPDQKLPRATPYAADQVVKEWHIDALAGAGALRSTAADMMKFGTAMLKPEQTPLKDAFAIAMTTQADAPALGGQIGLGVFLGKFDGAAVYHHGGGTGGYRTELQVIPAQGSVRVVLINNDSLEGSAVIAATSEAKPKAPVVHQEIKLPVATLEQYPGVYEIDRDTRFTLLLRDGQLWVRLTGQPFLRLFASGPDRFFYKAVEAELVFQREQGAVKSLTLLQNGNEITAKRTADPLPSVTLRTAKELQPYSGSYAVIGMKNIAVTVRVGTLFAQLEGQPAMPVFEAAPDRFEYDLVKAELVFTRDDQQQINGLTLLQNGMTLPAPKVMNRSSGPKP